MADPVTGAVVAAHGGPATQGGPAPHGSPAADEPGGTGTPNGPRPPDGAGAPSGSGIPDRSGTPDGPGTPNGSGTPDGSNSPDYTAVAVLDWARTEDARAGFEDAMITTEQAYHLVRAAHGASGRVLVYLLLDRSRGNLALARRALARWPGTTAATSEPSLSSDDRTPDDHRRTVPPRPLMALPTRGDARPVTALPGPAALRPTAPRPVPPKPTPETTPNPGPEPDPADQTARPHTPPAVPARVTVPRQAPPPAAEQDPPVPVPLPRRGGGTPPASTTPAYRAPGNTAPADTAPTSTAPADRGPAEPPDGAGSVTPAAPPGGRWADDVSTMARILEGLRRLGQSRGPES